MTHVTHIFPRLCGKHLLPIFLTASHLDYLQGFTSYLVSQRISSLLARPSTTMLYSGLSQHSNMDPCRNPDYA
jgi:hypothetical protein